MQRDILRFVWQTQDDGIVKGPISSKDVYRPIDEGGCNLLNIEVMRQSILTFWIQKLEMNFLKEKQDRDAWYDFTTTLLINKAPLAVKHMLHAPWRQAWTSRPAALPPSLNYLHIQKLDSMIIPPSSRSEAEGIDFWCHPSLLNGYQSVKWGAPVWKGLYNQRDEQVNSVRKIDNLLDIQAGRQVATTSERNAIFRLLQKLPEVWKEEFQSSHQSDSLSNGIQQLTQDTGVYLMMPHRTQTFWHPFDTFVDEMGYP
ncbi:hypothetical protein K3495_g13070 [Podosphaera aphanis]|nr:hypothetical protein K3495_g13070 [Podosphaera aphanis]